MGKPQAGFYYIDIEVGFFSPLSPYLSLPVFVARDAHAMPVDKKS